MIIGNKEVFAIELNCISIDEHECEIKMFVNNDNICAFRRRGEKRYKSTRWNLDELINYLDSTINMLYSDEQFPIENIDGECAAELDNNARDFEIQNDNEMEKYYDSLNDWSYQHSWHHANSGAILADVFFRKTEKGMEISWWSDQSDDGIVFKNVYGYTIIDPEEYKTIISETIETYNDMWL